MKSGVTAWGWGWGEGGWKGVCLSVPSVMKSRLSFRVSIRHGRKSNIIQGRVEGEEEIDERTRLTRGTSTCDVRVGWMNAQDKKDYGWFWNRHAVSSEYYADVICGWFHSMYSTPNRCTQDPIHTRTYVHPSYLPADQIHNFSKFSIFSSVPIGVPAADCKWGRSPGSASIGIVRICLYV